MPKGKHRHKAVLKNPAFDARTINQNGAQPIVTAKQTANLPPQVGDKPQATQITNNTANNSSAQQSGQQQAFTGGDGNSQNQPQNQPQNQSQSQAQSAAQNNQQPNSPTQADNSNNSARFNQHFSESAHSRYVNCISN